MSTNLKQFRCTFNSSNVIQLFMPISNDYILMSFLNEMVAKSSAFYNKTKGDRVAREGFFLRSSVDLVFSNSCHLDPVCLKCCRRLLQQSNAVAKRAFASSPSKRKVFTHFPVPSQVPLKWFFSANL